MMNEKVMNNILRTIFFIAFAFIFELAIVSGAADFAVNSFSCPNTEVTLNSVFSCTAQIINNGDSAGSVSVATLYPDAGGWLEQASYAQSSGTSVSPGQTTEVSFTGLRAIETGSNGFSRILLDDVTDTYVADNNVDVNVISIVIDVSNSVSSTGMNQTFDSSSEVTAGGNIDVTLTFSVDSGGCSIGSQSATKSIANMQDGNRQTRSWTVTQGTTGNCRFTISAAATGDAGAATTSDSSSNTVTCTDCPVESSSSSSSSSGGGSSGGGGGGIEASSLGELPNVATSVSLGQNQFVKFTINNEEHKLKVTNLTAEFVSVSIESTPQLFKFFIGDEKRIDLDSDKKEDIVVKLKSINIITNRATFDLTSLKEPAKKSSETGKETESGAKGEGGSGGAEIDELIEGLKKGAKSKTLWIVIGVIVIVVLVYLAIRHAPRRDSIRGKVKIRSGKDIIVR